MASLVCRTTLFLGVISSTHCFRKTLLLCVCGGVNKVGERPKSPKKPKKSPKNAQKAQESPMCNHSASRPRIAQLFSCTLALDGTSHMVEFNYPGRAVFAVGTLRGFFAIYAFARFLQFDVALFLQFDHSNALRVFCNSPYSISNQR